ncbi:MAG TPA: LacI family DNA-binding transcriptional regulator [Herpetosiphonaceae bacterium]|nr:LacI family DNA-binding transcriptional regulator [Herpetosiphonaceae bacterium]
MTIQRQQKITIKDIARICNVSTQTVSRVLNNRPDVSPQTREAVEKAIAEMGYQPSALARSLVQQHSSMLGVITAGLRYSGVSQTLNGITEQCEASNYALLLKELPRFDVADITPIIDSLIARHVDGIIFAAPELGENVRTVQAQLPAACPPIVFLKSQPSDRYTTVGVDNYGGARQVVEHLLASGRRRIGLISGPLEWLEARQRHQGWVDALAAAGIAVGDGHWRTGNWSSASGAAAFAELVAGYPDLDAVFASNDQMALGVLHAAAARGLRVPADLAVAGFDDLPESPFFTPALTTVNHPLRELGSLAVKTLLAQLEGADEAAGVQTISLRTQLVVRESTGGGASSY